MHVPAPLAVQFRPDAFACGSFVAFAHGLRVSDYFSASPKEPLSTVYTQWARAFLEGVRRAPMVAGVRS